MQKILWQKWVDPLARLVRGSRINLEEEEEDEEEDRPHFFSTELPHKNIPTDHLGPVMVGAFGIIPLWEGNEPGKLFNFWIGHTNFDLTPEVVGRIEAIPGVETLDVFTRYRFRLGVGRAFMDRKVREAIDDVCAPLPEPASPAQPKGLDALCVLLGRQFPAWAIYVFPNGKAQCVGGQTRQEVEEKGKRFVEWATEVRTSW